MGWSGGLFCAKDTTWIPISLRVCVRVWREGWNWTESGQKSSPQTRDVKDFFLVFGFSSSENIERIFFSSGFWFLILKGGVAFFVWTGLTWMAFGSPKTIKLLLGCSNHLDLSLSLQRHHPVPFQTLAILCNKSRSQTAFGKFHWRNFFFKDCASPLHEQFNVTIRKI